MPPGEILVTCASCQHRLSLPIAAVRRDNFYCPKCYQKIPLSGLRTASADTDTRSQAARPKKSSRTQRR
jgi:predicted RNA-binding Zn-ribbon protein involved in translation (DUF1610 family)